MRHKLIIIGQMQVILHISKKKPIISVVVILYYQNNMLTRGAVGVLCQPPDERKEAGAYGYILRSDSVCNYALRCDNSCYLHYTQK